MKRFIQEQIISYDLSTYIIMRKYVNGPFSDTNGKKDSFLNKIFIHKRVNGIGQQA